MKKQLTIVPLEERILLDAAIAAVIAHPLAAAADGHGSNAADASASHAAVADSGNLSSQTASAVIYVNANASGSVHDGKTWATAFVNLQDALNKAGNSPTSDQIWIAQGTYLPTKIYSPNGVVGGASGLNDVHLKTFDIPTNVSLYGGFKSGMTSLNQANPDVYKTILSGDLLGNDINNRTNANYAASKADNAWHVITMGNDITQEGVTASLNGITVINGYANGPAGTPTFAPFVYNHDYGGGLIAFNSSVTMNRDLFQYNYAKGDGGGIFTNNVDLTVRNSSFLNNFAVTRGGAMEVFNTFEGATPHTANVIDSYFKDNEVTVFGGAIVGEGSYPNLASSMNVIGSAFEHNMAPEGGAITVDSLTFNVDKSTFINNIASVNGGALATTNIVDSIIGGPNEFITTVTNSSFISNISKGDIAAHEALNNFLGFPIGINFSRGGGALDTYITGHMIVKDSLFLNNVAQSGNGGAILNGYASGNNVFGSGLTVNTATTEVYGSTFIGNRALDGNGGAIASSSDHILPDDPADLSLIVKNSNFLGNSASKDGGGIYVDTSLLADKGNLFLGNQSLHGDQLYATNGVVNDIPTSSPLARVNQILVNKFVLLDNDDLYLT